MMENNQRLIKKMTFIFLSFWLSVFTLDASDSDDEEPNRKRSKRSETSLEEGEAPHKILFSLVDFSPEINIRILANMTPSELLSVQQVCKKFDSLIKETPQLFYPRELHYGIHLGSIQTKDRTAYIKFSRDGYKWGVHHPMKIDGHLVTGVENLSLAQFQNQHYAAIVQKRGLKSELQVLVCQNGISWTLVSTFESGPLLDVQLAIYQGKLWLAYIPLETHMITLTHSSTGSEWSPCFQTSLPKATKLSLADSGNQFYIAYTRLLEEELPQGHLLQRSDTRPLNEDSAQTDHNTVFEANIPEIPLLNTKRFEHVEAEEAIHIASSKDGDTWGILGAWETPRRMPNSLQLVPYQGRLRLAYAETNRRVVQIGSSENGIEWRHDDDCKTLNMLNSVRLYTFQGNLFLSYTCEGAGESPLMFNLQEDGKWMMLSRFILAPKDGSLPEEEN